MTPEEYGRGDWTTGEIACARALWEHNNPHRPVAKLHPNIADAWMIYLPAARVAFNVFKSYAKSRQLPPGQMGSR